MRPQVQQQLEIAMVKQKYNDGIINYYQLQYRLYQVRNKIGDWEFLNA